MQLAKAERAASALAIGLQETRIDRVGEQRHMAEHVVENVGLLQIVELGLGTDEGPGGKSPIGEMLEEGVVGDEPRDRDHAPACESRDTPAEIREIRHAAA